jgi:hypothetical protein
MTLDESENVVANENVDADANVMLCCEMHAQCAHTHIYIHIHSLYRINKRTHIDI